MCPLSIRSCTSSFANRSMRRFTGTGVLQIGEAFTHDCLLKQGRLRILRPPPVLTKTADYLH